ncbi:UDP-N-acetylglucosamine--undecaprenyl-phosphate N-acetylglucosaminephosphotransferase [Planctobacterium marinum]|uniref:UDP-N-acetylglucosamine--undecaprenyl-phosphate N-acetylglucosaminephosphotransferase n=1 Tax=Planctobacterium marinum TaxID=1631968 RepID=UPI001E64058A|nr:UDP-N-acetylglucosamine--undecaprenyl-phosphate N-acetylglucosaminephosphotransferase [Planctobacterium marinum]MCC2606162.1 UDP-N-acetylglucosamine--undecaprenyl-phosphate N-acetylglucosaminephosphotransferase [Planctobacterium marinum]
MITTTTILALLLASLGCYTAIKLVKPFALKVGLVDIPNHRKIHSGEVPLVGGIAVYLGVLTASSVLLPQGQLINIYLISAGLIVLLGALDDYKDLSVGVRIIAQILIASLMVYGAGIHLTNFGDILFGLSTQLGWFGYPLTILATIAAINAFNMTDGIDGLAGMLSLVAFAGIALLMMFGGEPLFVLPLILASSIVPFLFFNLGIIGGRAKKIFMGDAGSMFVGLSIVWLLVIGTQGEQTTFRPVTALWLIAVPFLDMCAITIRRLLKRRSPFKPDKEHVHHIVMRLGLSARSALVFITLISLILAAFGLCGEYYQWPESFMFTTFMMLFVVYFFALKHAWRVSKFIRKFLLKRPSFN